MFSKNNMMKKFLFILIAIISVLHDVEAIAGLDNAGASVYL